MTLNAEESSAQGMQQAPVSLPSGEGSARNSGYALQWWVFAAFALGMAIKLAHTLGVKQRNQDDAVLGPDPGAGAATKEEQTT